jgi:hypothetical protein
LALFNPQSESRNPQSVVVSFSTGAPQLKALTAHDFNDFGNFYERVLATQPDKPRQVLIQGGSPRLLRVARAKTASTAATRNSAPPEGSTMCQGLPAKRLQTALAALLVTASCSALAVAQSGDEWRAAGSAPSASSQSAATAQGWRLPNGQSNAGDAAQADEDSNPLRKPQTSGSTTKAEEPRAFQPPKNAAPMNGEKPLSGANANYTNSAAQFNRSAPNAPRPGTFKPQAYTPQQQQASRAQAVAQRPAVQPNYRPAPHNQNQNRQSSPTGELYSAINVAFQGPPTNSTNAKSAPGPQNSVMKKSPENLPMPGDGDYQLNDPVMRYPGGPGEFADRLGGNCYQPYCEQGMCSGGSCPTGCAGPCCGE